MNDTLQFECLGSLFTYMNYELNYLGVDHTIRVKDDRTMIFTVPNCSTELAYKIGVRYGVVRKKYKVKI
jgi:hypothetical protein